MKIRSLISALVPALVLLATGQAQASVGSYGLTYQSTNGVIETTNLSSGFLTGQMLFTDATGTTFAAYCVEIAQSRAETSDGSANYTVASFSGSQAALLQGLYSSSYAGLSSATDQAAFQTAVWEITQDATGVTNAGKASNLSGLGTLEVNPTASTKGNFYFATLGTLRNQAPAAENTAFINQVNGYLNQAQAYVNNSGVPMYTLTLLQNPDFQDLITATPLTTPVPEPESYVLLMAGLGVVGFVARRRQQAR
jgi:hypothetical protein